MWPTFEAEWGQIADMPEGPIARLSEAKRPLLEQLFWFLLIRTKWTDEAMPRQHPVMLLRHTVIQASAWLMEVHIHLRIVADQHRRTAVVPTALTGPGGGRVKKCAVARLRCLEKIVHSFGSDQVTVSALGHRRGSAAIMRGIRNRMYQDLAQSHCCIFGPIFYELGRRDARRERSYCWIADQHCIWICLLLASAGHGWYVVVLVIIPNCIWSITDAEQRVFMEFIT